MSHWIRELVVLAESEFHGRHVLATLATVDANGDARARTVIVRRLDERDGSVWITTDARSAKVAQIAARPRGELVIWTPHEREQYRLSGPIDIVREGPERETIWDQMRPHARAVFFWPQPGAPRAQPGEFTDAALEGSGPPPSFVLLVLRPTEVESLELNETPHRRRRWRQADGVWQGPESINP